MSISFVAPTLVITPPVAAPPPRAAVPGADTDGANSVGRAYALSDSVVLMPISHPCRLSHAIFFQLSRSSCQLFVTLWSSSALPLTNLTPRRLAYRMGTRFRTLNTTRGFPAEVERTNMQEVDVFLSRRSDV